MSRETENVLLLLIGLCTAMIVWTGTYTRYVKPSLMPWLVVTAVLLVTLALCAIVRDVRAQGRRDDDADHHDDVGHAHRVAVVWLLVLPIALLAFVIPPALSGRAAAPTVTEVSREVLYRPFPELPAGRAPELPLAEVVSRADLDSANTLDGRLITVTGFTLKEGDGIDLGKVVIICCAADARLARLHMRGPAAAEADRYPEETWFRVEGVVVPEPQAPSGLAIPTLTVTTLMPVEAPKHPYGY
ncbi:TIGR03943 family protein [Mycobacterium antarcticum]|uniref:TIGR03943 family putative permease subunit n=1 Tax=unclassified Mycolicibacterium TaxID=2636767 RepID=UPI0023A1CBCF|nr:MULTISPECIES: TIGR03943 family protein [unclassified Mycolicibacterium]BDX33344.1 TIGR03943 family protein [Mycolicibacterium sp. TUM20985]GLP83085.1 TIGR03943 family protein [Mycolicibacterium sp. TUM20984]